MRALGWLHDLKYTIREVKYDLEYKLEELGDSIKEKAEDLGNALGDGVEDSFEVFERRGEQKVEDICNKIDKIEQADSIREKVSYALTSSRELRNIERKKEFNKRNRAKKGDIIGVVRFAGIRYEHYGVYIGNNEVVHFTKYNGKNTIIKTSMKEFMKNNKSNDKYFILDCEGTYNYKNDMNIFEDSTINSSGLSSKIPSVIRKPIEIYSPDDTVIRAKQHIGEQEYNLGVNNCEHFAIWCKTGLKYSYQVNNLLGSRFMSNNKKWIDYCMNNDTY